MPVKEWTQKCQACGGTGLYVGMAERSGAAVVCYRCKGTGEQKMRFEYEEFTGRRTASGVTTVYAVNPGIVAAPGVVPGGVPFKEWERDPAAPQRVGAEMRQHTCPAWWYQTANYNLKPDWDECGIGGLFTQCRYFPEKAKCWERWDREFGEKKP